MTWRRGEAGSTLIDRPNDAPVPDFHECQGKGYRVFHSDTLSMHRSSPAPLVEGAIPPTPEMLRGGGCPESAGEKLNYCLPKDHSRLLLSSITQIIIVIRRAYII